MRARDSTAQAPHPRPHRGAPAGVAASSLEVRARSALRRTVEAVVPEPMLIACAVVRRHKRTFGVVPNLIAPRTFSEKVLHRMVFDRRPILITLTDKYAVRAYVRDRIGDHVLPQLYW